jgi:hypothetical protein
VRKIAAQFGVDPSTVQRISRPAIWSDVSVALHDAATMLKQLTWDDVFDFRPQV